MKTKAKFSEKIPFILILKKKIIYRKGETDVS